MFFISASTVLHQVVFGRSCFCFPSGVLWIATLVMELASLHSTCPIQRHRFLLMMVSISSGWHRAKRSWLEMILGQKMRWIFLRLVVWKDDSLGETNCLCERFQLLCHLGNHILPSRLDCVCSVFSCDQTLAWLPMLGICNAQTCVNDVTAHRGCTTP